MRLEGRVAVVTGASRGIGLGIALRLAEEGAKLVVNAAEKKHLEACVQGVTSLGRPLEAVAGDISLPKTAEALVRAALGRWDRLDIVVNCAGINQDGMLHKMSDEQWRRVVDVDLNGAFYLTGRAAREMRRAGWGRIVNISSAAWQGNLGQANYAAAKAGLVALTRTAARELGRYGVTCNAVCPGLIETDMTRLMPESERARILSRVPAGRMGTPAEVSGAVAFLCSEEAAYINGQVLGVDGGLVL